ncbi:siderophore synthetase component [Streptacidiphilus sp. MAP12-16]|uniref:IucA/IucC family protein n=1 Tax=Streptacidiphilus sp. MAP12-16 TaxID=3156300 RepID=UPI003513D5B2
MHPDSAPLPRPLEASFVAELRAVRPDLVAPFTEALPGARAAVMARLWRSMRFEHLPGLAGRQLRGPELRSYDVRRHDARAPTGELTVRVDGRAYTHPADVIRVVEGSGGFAAELEHSVASLALSRAGAAGPGGDGRSLVAYEQSVVDGHPYHPCCRSRPGFSVADQLAYAPEHRPLVALGLVPVPAASCVVVGDWPDRLRDGDRVLLPAHPWQLREVLPGLGLGPAHGEVPAHPLMSLRTLAPVDGGPHLKTALSLRMTSAVRDISGESVVNSAPLSALLEDLFRRLDGSLRLTRNIAAASALVGGAPSPDLAVLLRESPEVHAGPGERVVPLAALAEHPLDTADSVAWLGALAGLVWTPLLRLLDWGVALEAHGQNLLVVLDQADRPVRLVYRDLADVRVSAERLSSIGVRLSGLGGHVLDGDPTVLRRKLFGSLVGGMFSSLVSALGGGIRPLEADLWGAVAAEAGKAAVVLRPGDRRALLEEPLPVKALSLMRLDGAPPGDRWTLLPNPLAAAEAGLAGR